MLPEPVRNLAKGKNFGVFTTLRADGSPTGQVMWVDCDDECLLINTERHRRKYANVRRDPRVTVAIWAHDNPYQYAEVRGIVEEFIFGPRAREHIDELAQRYFGRPYDPSIITSERVILRIRPVSTVQRAGRGAD